MPGLPRKGGAGMSANIHTRLWNAIPPKTDNPGLRYLRSDVCRECLAPVLRGEDDDQGALWVTVDPTPLSVPGEALAILTGRATFELAGHRGGLVLYHRDHRLIAYRKAGEKADVLPEHRCDAPELPRAALRRRLSTATTASAPPF